MPDNHQSDYRRTDGGAYVEGNPQTDGDFIGRDQHTHGNTVSGDKIVNIPNPSPVVREQSAPPSSQCQRAVTTNTILVGIFSLLGAILTNVATGLLIPTPLSGWHNVLRDR